MRHPQGLIGWVDLMTPDVEVSRTFYSDLFGWTSTDMPTPMGVDYTQFYKDGQLVAGMGPMPSEMSAAGAPPVWSSYVIVEDLDATLAKVAAAGGQVVMPAMDIMSEGRMAMAADPSGGVIGIWQPLDHQGADLFNAPGAVTWNELQSRGLDAAKPFYEQVFGWRWELDEPGSDYWVIKLDSKAGDDKSNGGAMPVPPGVPEQMPSTWFTYFAVDDCDDMLARANAIGGSTMFDPMDMGDMRFAGVIDPVGGMFMVIAFDAPPEA